MQEKPKVCIIDSVETPDRDLIAEISRLKSVWGSMVGRTTRPTHKQWSDYGGRGIYLCEEWADFVEFAYWAISNGSGPGLQIDRINNDGPYHPDNCRFVSALVNNHNRRSTRRYECWGETKTILEWLADPRCTVQKDRRSIERRINVSGWSVEEALTVSSPNHLVRLCTQGHLLDEENSRYRKSGSRYCGQCARDRAKAYYYSRKDDPIFKEKNRMKSNNTYHEQHVRKQKGLYN